MRHSSWRLVLFALAVGVLVSTAESGLNAHHPLQAKESSARQVDFLSVDQVELKGMYYPSGRTGAPCVMLLHALGESSSNKEWTNFAKKLQARGFAVLAFDFRGHGDSTKVKPGAYDPKKPQKAERGFWDETANQQGVKGFAVNKARPTEIRHEQFKATYYSVLANDIAAAKAFLDEQSDCNSSNLVLIGAKDGGTLGALWLNSEWHRFRYLPPAPGLPQGSLDRQNPEGQAVKAAAWLSISSTFGANKPTYKVAEMLDVPARANKVPMLFIYGEGDAKGQNLASACEKFLVGKNKKHYPHTAAVKIAGAEQLTGRSLLLESQPTATKILELLEAVVEMKGDAKARRTTDDNFMWDWLDRNGVRQQVIARKKGGKIEFNNYLSFLR